MGKPAARLLDIHACPIPGHVPNPIVQGSPDVYTNSRNAARVTDKEACGSAILSGSAGVFINGLAATRLTDPTTHGGKIVTGSFNVFIGETKSPPVHPKPVIKKGKHSNGAGDSAASSAASVASSSSSAAASSNMSLPPSLLSKKVAPSSLVEAASILEERRAQITEEGYQPKYSDSELQKIAKSGNIGEDRFQVRFMEERYLNDRETPDEPLSGKMGMLMKGETGEGAKYWSTSFDQLEDADTDPKIISEKLGLEYDPQKDYALAIVDSHLAAPITGVKSVSATFENLSEFANTELPKKFPKDFTDQVMNPEFQAHYAQHYAAAVESKALPNAWSRDTEAFQRYLQTTDLSGEQQELLLTRMDMHDVIGNNQDYLGNGLTKDIQANSPNQYGAVETLNFERSIVNLKTLDDVNAITIIRGLEPV